MSENAVTIREFSSADRQAVRRIACETAFPEGASSALFGDDEILADALTLYFTDYEPNSCFVAWAGAEVIGYIIGSKNVAAMKRIFFADIIPGLLIKGARRGTFFRKKSGRFLMNLAFSFLKGEFSTPDFSRKSH